MKALVILLTLTTLAVAGDNPKFRYEYVSMPATYDEAIAKALKKGGKLVKIEDAKTNEQIRKMIRSKAIWLGANDRYKEGRWVWTDGSKVTYNNWRVKPPKRRKANCAIMDSSGQWRDVIGHDKRPYVIMYPVKSKPHPTFGK